MHCISSRFIARNIFLVGLFFSFICCGYSLNSHIEKCANKCATNYCGMAVDEIVFNCQRQHLSDPSGHVDFNLKEEHKLKLPNCFASPHTGLVSKSKPQKPKGLENIRQFEDCLLRCKVELVNWCQP